MEKTASSAAVAPSASKGKIEKSASKAAVSSASKTKVEKVASTVLGGKSEVGIDKSTSRVKVQHNVTSAAKKERDSSVMGLQ